MILANYKVKHCFEMISNTFESITNLQQLESCKFEGNKYKFIRKVTFYRIITKNSNFSIILSINL